MIKPSIWWNEVFVAGTISSPNGTYEDLGTCTASCAVLVPLGPSRSESVSILGRYGSSLFLKKSLQIDNLYDTMRTVAMTKN